MVSGMAFDKQEFVPESHKLNMVKTSKPQLIVEKIKIFKINDDDDVDVDDNLIKIVDLSTRTYGTI